MPTDSPLRSQMQTDSQMRSHTLMRLHMVARLTALLLFVGVLGAAPAQAQGLTAASGVAVFRYAPPGEPTMDIHVWGAVRSAGIYQVERTATLVDVLTVAGGPALPAETDRAEQTVRVEVVRDPAGARTVVLAAKLDALTGQDVTLPELEDGDLVTLTSESRQRFTWRDALSVTSSVASLALLILRIVE
jgi:hypothetical protein